MQPSRLGRASCLALALAFSVFHVTAQAQNGSSIDSKLFERLEWRSIGPCNMGGRTADVEGVPGNPNIVYAGTASGGVWKTTNGGTSWTPIFEREHTMSLDRLRTINKRDARQFLRELPSINPFVEAYIMLYGFEGPAIPVDNETVKYLSEEGVLEEKATPDDAQKFLEHNLKAEECYDFFVCLRRAVFGETKGRKKAKV